jgi:hypothetical protein
MILRLLLPNERFFSSLVFATVLALRCMHRRFVDKQGEWVPVLASAAEALEDAYSREIWTHTHNSADPVRVHITGSEQKLHAYFLSATEMWLCGGTVTKSVMSMFSFGSAVRSSGMRLRRGLEGTFVYTVRGPLTYTDRIVITLNAIECQCPADMTALLPPSRLMIAC